MSVKTLLSAMAFLPLVAKALNPNCAPGGNFDMSPWQLQLPTGTTGHPDTESSSKLQGCSGYQDAEHIYFYTESGDGALVMKVPGSPASAGCVTTAHSKHCRTELREINPSSWDPNASKNRLTVSLKVINPDNSQYGTVIGQIHIDDQVSTKPVCELFYSSSGILHMGVEQTRSGGKVLQARSTPVGSIPVGTLFSYEIAYEKNVSLDAPLSYFKVGNYNQGTNASDVHFFAIDVEH